MKKFITLVLFVNFCCIGSIGATFAASKCWAAADFSDPSSVSVGSALQDCTPDGAITTKVTPPNQGGVVSVSTDPGDYTIEGGVKERIKSLTYQLMIVGGILSVGAIVLSGIFYIIALGDDKKVTDAKNALKYSIIGFVCIIIAFPLVNAIVNLIFGIAWGK